jgi:hypothetical protein
LAKPRQARNRQTFPRNSRERIPIPVKSLKPITQTIPAVRNATAKIPPFQNSKSSGHIYHMIFPLQAQLSTYCNEIYTIRLHF